MVALSVLPLGVTLAMKVLIALNSAWNLLNFRANLIKALVADGHTVVLAAPADEHVASLMALGARFIDLPMRTHSVNPLADLILVGRFVRLLKRERPDVLLGYTVKPNVYGSLAALTMGIPVVNNITGLGTVLIRGGLLANVLQNLYRFALARSRRIFFQNPEDLQLFLNLGLVRQKQAGLLPGSGVDLKLFKPAPLPCLMQKALQDTNKRFVFLLVARLLKDKGIQEYAEAAKIVKSQYPMVEFALLGSKDLQNPNSVPEYQLKTWQQQGLINYWGVSNDMCDSLGNADCVVLPSYREGTPRSLLEAAAMARPLIATDVPGCREVVKHGYNGLLCLPYNAQDLAKQMETLIKLSDCKLEQMGLASRKLVEEKFDEEIVINLYLKH